MKRLRRFVLSVLSIGTAVGFAQSSWAACNVIPDPTVQLVSAPDLSGEAKALQEQVIQENAKFGGMVPYKGALGRIDRVYLTPERTDPIRVAADGRCVRNQRQLPFDVGATDDLVAVMIVTTASGEHSAFVTGGKGLDCSALNALAPRERLKMNACTNTGIASVEGQSQVLQLTLPSAASAAGAQAIKIGLFRAASPDQISATLQPLATTDCASVCGEATHGAAVGVCIDKIYSPTGLTASKALLFDAQDMVKCEVMATPSPIPWNDFADQCQNGNGSSGLPNCQNAPTTLSAWEDDCHGVYVPFDWTDIRVAAPDEFDRKVRGQSGISVGQEWQGGRVWIPGAEFVGTLSEADVKGPGGPFETNPRSAQIDVWYPTKEEFGLQGVVDKNRSIVHVVPRLGASLLCNTATDEACMGVPTHPDIDATRCACRDEYPADCTCTALSVPRYFQCSTSKMPCTRHAHCGVGELCNTQPTCQPAGKLWEKTATGGVAKCWTDAHCTDSSAAGYDPNTPQCGYMLFDVHAKRESAKSDVILKAKLLSSGKKRRGVCKSTASNARKVCDNSSGNPGCTTAEGDCTEYVLEALGGTKVAP